MASAERRPVLALRAGGPRAEQAFRCLVGHLAERYRYHPRIRCAPQVEAATVTLAAQFVASIFGTPLQAEARSAEGWGRLDLLLSSWLNAEPSTPLPSADSRARRPAAAPNLAGIKANAQRWISAWVAELSEAIPRPWPGPPPQAVSGLAAEWVKGWISKGCAPLAPPAAQQLWRVELGRIGLLVALCDSDATTLRGALVHDQQWLDDAPLAAGGPLGQFYQAPWCPLVLPRSCAAEWLADLAAMGTPKPPPEPQLPALGAVHRAIAAICREATRKHALS